MVLLCCSFIVGGSEEQKPEELNKRALTIIQRVKDKLTGMVQVLVTPIHTSRDVRYTKISYHDKTFCVTI